MKQLKLNILFVILFIASFRLYSQDTASYVSVRSLLDNVTHVFKDNHPELSFFKYHLISTDGNVYDWYNGKNDNTDSITDIIGYLNAVKDLEMSNYNLNDNSVKLLNLETNMIRYLQDGLTPLSLSFIEYSDFKDSTIILDLVGWRENQFTETIQDGYYPFMKKNFFSASALNHVIKTPQINFYMDDSLILSNIRNKIDSIYVDFDDSQGFVSMPIGSVYPVTYNSYGLKNCVVKLKSENVYYYSRFQIYDSTQVEPQYGKSSTGCNTTPLLPDAGPIAISTNYSGNTISGRYAVWYSHCNTERVMRKPYIISVGVNPGNGKQLVPYAVYPNDITVNINGATISIPVTYGWRGTYYETYNGGYSKRFSPIEAALCGEGSSNQNRYLDRLREEGYDIVILMFDNGTDYVENNAELISELIKKINVEKFANGYYFENVVSGYSAGALSTRLALSRMEEKYNQGKGPHPHTKLWVSVEGENQGANVPLGFQYLLDFQADPNTSLPSLAGLNSLQVAADFVNRTVSIIAQSFNSNSIAKELTLYTPSNPTGPSQERINMLSAFHSIAGNPSGYPTFSRRVGVGQGSSVGTMVPHTSSKVFDSQLKTNPFGNTYTAYDCKGSYTVYQPVAIKTTTARWWGSNNNQNIFDGNVYINANWTVMKRQCISGSFFGMPYCFCIGPFMISGQNTTIADKHIAKPTVTNNFDDAPGSTLAAHVELYSASAYPFYNNWFAGNSFANVDPSLHSFAPTMSTLDILNINDPTTGQPVNNFTHIDNLNILNINDRTGSLTQQPDKRFGFPYLAYPDNHYSVTPFDAVFAIGINNGTYSTGTPKPANQLHVEDPQIEMGDYLARDEVAPENLYLTNNQLASTSNNYTAEFEARKKLIVGKTDGNGINIYNLYNNQNYLSPNGDYKVNQNSTAIMHSGDQIELLPGFEVNQGANLQAYIKVYNCENLLNRVNSNKQTHNANSSNNYNLPYKGFDYGKPINKEADKKINSFLLYPNPSNGSFTYINVCDEQTSQLTICDLNGKIVYSTSIENNLPVDLDLTNLNNGFYIAQVINKKSKDNFKLTIFK